MAKGITNQATLTFDYGSSTGEALSNIAVATFQSPIIVSKLSLENTYRSKDEITYTIALTNSSTSALTNIQVFDNLGTYTTSTSVVTTPLTYIGDALFYINGLYISKIAPNVGSNGITFTIPALPELANAIIIYKAKVNEYALLMPQSVITSTITTTAAEVKKPFISTNEIVVEDYAAVSIIKNMYPNPVIYGGIYTYVFTIYNYGNIPAHNVVLTDIFSPILNNLIVTVNGVLVLSKDYNYAGGVIILPSSTSIYSITIPEATYTQDSITGVIIINPGMVNIKVSGTV